MCIFFLFLCLLLFGFYFQKTDQGAESVDQPFATGKGITVMNFLSGQPDFLADLFEPALRFLGHYG